MLKSDVGGACQGSNRREAGARCQEWEKDVVVEEEDEAERGCKCCSMTNSNGSRPRRGVSH